jgi:hypothetical protein
VGLCQGPARSGYLEHHDPRALTITDIGPVPDGFTLKMPGQFDEWDGSAWVKNEDAERAYLIAQADRQKAKLLSEASSRFHC